AGQRRSALQAFTAPVARPGHPDQVAVVEPSGAVEVWSLQDRRSVATVGVDAAHTQNSVVFDTTGSTLAVQSRNGQATLWNVDANRQIDRTIPTGLIDGLLGFTPDGKLVTLNTIATHDAQIWDA